MMTKRTIQNTVSTNYWGEESILISQNRVIRITEGISKIKRLPPSRSLSGSMCSAELIMVGLCPPH